MKALTLFVTIMMLSVAFCAKAQDASLKEPLNMMVKVEATDIDKWMTQTFPADADIRNQICDDSQTELKRVSNEEAIMFLYDVDLEAIDAMIREGLDFTNRGADNPEAVYNFYTFEAIAEW